MPVISLTAGRRISLAVMMFPFAGASAIGPQKRRSKTVDKASTVCVGRGRKGSQSLPTKPAAPFVVDRCCGPHQFWCLALESIACPQDAAIARSLFYMQEAVHRLWMNPTCSRCLPLMEPLGCREYYLGLTHLQVVCQAGSRIVVAPALNCALMVWFLELHRTYLLSILILHR